MDFLVIWVPEKKKAGILKKKIYAAKIYFFFLFYTFLKEIVLVISTMSNIYTAALEGQYEVVKQILENEPQAIQSKDEVNEIRIITYARLKSNLLINKNPFFKYIYLFFYLG